MGANGRGVGIGSTLAELRHAFPSVRCSNRPLATNTCGFDHGSRKARRSTDFGFDRAPGAAGVRVTSLRVTAWGVGYG